LLAAVQSNNLNNLVSYYVKEFKCCFACGHIELHGVYNVFGVVPNDRILEVHRDDFANRQNRLYLVQPTALGVKVGDVVAPFGIV
jgi:hypothetical protein